MFGEGFLLREGATYLLAAIAGTCAYAYIYAFVAAPPRPPRAAVVAASAATMLLWTALTVGFRVFAERWPGYDANYDANCGVFATLVAGADLALAHERVGAARRGVRARVGPTYLIGRRDHQGCALSATCRSRRIGATSRLSGRRKDHQL